MAAVGIAPIGTHGFKPEIQGLRAIAVLLVVVFHIWPASLTGGFVGVDVFFVISGYLITGLLLREVEQHGRIRLGYFYARRIKRLLPAAAVVLVAIAGGALLLTPEAFWRDTAVEIVASGLYFENWWLAYGATDYFEQDAIASPLQHFWSLSVEEQFYIFWPLLIMLGAALAARIRCMPVAALVASVFAASLAYSVWVTPRYPEFAYFATTARAWELALGGMLALVHRRWQPTAGPAWLLCHAGLAAILVAGCTYSLATPFPGYTALLPTVGTALVILAGSGAGQRRWSGYTVLRAAPMQFLGGISYSLYLWHWPLIVFYQLAVGRPPTIAEGAGVLLASIALATASKYLVEDRFYKSAIVPGGLWKPYGLGALCMLACLAAAAPLALSARPATDGPAQGSVSGGLVMAPGYRPPMTPGVADARKDIAEEYRRCHAGFAQTAIERCGVGALESEVVIALVGDSHAGHWAPTLFEIAEELGARVDVYTKSSCPFTSAGILRKNTEHDEAYRECDQWNRRLIDLLVREKPDLVVVSGSSKTPAVHQPGERSVDAIARGYTEYWTVLDGAGIPILAIRDTPRPGSSGINPPVCLSDSAQRVSDCAASRHDALLPEMDDAIFLASRETGFAHYLDMTDWICGAFACDPIIGGVMVWRDTNHLTETFARTLAPTILPDVRTAMGKKSTRE